MKSSTRPPRSFTVTLPRRIPWFIVGGFIFGALLFLALGQGEKKTFYRGETQQLNANETQPSSLPAPLAGDFDFELEPTSTAGAGDKSRLVETPIPTVPQPDIAPEPSAATPPLDETSRETIETPPQRIIESSPAPTYPTEALRSGETGTVLLDVTVDANGAVTDVSIAARSGSRSLDRAAISAVERWRFTPATADGQPVARRIQIPIDFTQ